MWTQKESSYLQDLKSQEQLCVEKYGKYAQQAHDPALKQLFQSLGQVEQQHLQTVETMISGTVPPLPAGSSQQQQQPQAPAQPSYGAAPSPNRQQDAYLCQDALGTEKHVSSEYDTAIFEFCTPEARQMLNHLQKEEQHHGEVLFQYMQRNGMYQVN